MAELQLVAAVFADLGPADAPFRRESGKKKSISTTLTFIRAVKGDLGSKNAAT